MTEPQDDALAELEGHGEEAPAGEEWRPEDEPVQRRRLPRWVWIGCGCGCLVVLLVAAGLLLFTWRYMKVAKDPELQWPRLEQILPFDQRPPGVEITLGTAFNVHQFMLVDHDHGLFVRIYPLGNERNADTQKDDLLDPDYEGIVRGIGQPVGARAGEVEVQGREVRAMWFQRIRPEPEGEKSPGPGIRVDLTSDQRGPTVLEIRTGPGGEEPGQKEVDEFLAPFHVWSDK